MFEPTWKNKKLEDCSKEELIECVYFYHNLYEETIRNNNLNQQIDVVKDVIRYNQKPNYSKYESNNDNILIEF